MRFSKIRLRVKHKVTVPPSEDFRLEKHYTILDDLIPGINHFQRNEMTE